MIDNDFLYSDLYFSRRTSSSASRGRTGRRADPADANNLPANYNGAKSTTLVEERATNPTTHMGPMGKFSRPRTTSSRAAAGRATRPTRGSSTTPQSRSPAQSCPGQVVLITGHNDSTPTIVERRQRRSERQPHTDEQHARRQLGQRLAVRRRLRHRDGDGRVPGPAALVPGERAPTRSARSRQGSSTPRRPASSARASTRRPTPRRRCLRPVGGRSNDDPRRFDERHASRLDDRRRPVRPARRRRRSRPWAPRRGPRRRSPPRRLSATRTSR